MVTTARGLGKDFDVCHAIAPVDLETAANTGARLHLKNYAGVTIVIYAGAGTANDDLQCDVQEHNAATGGTSQDLDVVTSYYHKQETTLDGDEAWSKTTQAAASEITDAGGAGTSAEQQNLVVIEVSADQLSDDFEWISVNIPDLGAAGAKLGCALYIPWGLKSQRAPENLPQPNA